MSTFVLVHGAWHGAWCWGRLVPQLEALGHEAIVMDLPCDQPVGLAGSAAVVVDACAHVDGPVIVVGHSLAGLTIPLVPERRPVERLVFIAGVTTRPGQSYFELAAEDFSVPGSPSPEVDLDSGFVDWRSTEDARLAMYQDCTLEEATWAIDQFRRQHLQSIAESSPLVAWPDVPVSYLVPQDDLLVSPAWMRTHAKERLGVEPIEVPGSHSCIFSQPGEVAAILDSLTR